MDAVPIIADDPQTVAEPASEEPGPLGGEPAKSLQMQVERNDTGQFLRGQSGNPAGRAWGTRNRATMIMEQLFDGASTDVSKKALAAALDGDGATLRLIIRSLIGPRRQRASSFALPPLQGAADVAPAIAAIASAAAEGAISTGEASEMSRVVESYMRALAAEEIETRLQRLESACGIAE